MLGANEICAVLRALTSTLRSRVIRYGGPALCGAPFLWRCVCPEMRPVSIRGLKSSGFIFLTLCFSLEILVGATGIEPVTR